MRLAIALGERGHGQTWPNPAVGCVVAKDGRIVGRGWTAPGGRPHAEPQALAQAGAQARGATVYVSLEPCAHYGQTPPCSEALIAAGVARVLTPLQDPDPRVAGKGLAMLRAAGITVETGLRAAEAEAAQLGFLLRMREGRPMVTLKLASSFDGRIATKGGESRWITGVAARRWVHGLRARHDAVLIGGGTARADDPMLTVRDLGVTRQPVRLVASRRLDLDPGSALGRTAGEVPLWLLHDPHSTPSARRTAWEATGARLLPVTRVASDTSGLDAQAMLLALGEAGLTRVFCEGGGHLAAALLRAGLVDELIGFTAGLALGADGHAAIGALGLDHLADAPRFQLVGSQALGGDLSHRWRRMA